MALTKISRGLLSTGVSDSSDATAITIDSSERVGIGTSSPDRNLTVFASNPVLNIKNSTANLHLEQAGHNGYIGNNSSSGFIQVFTNNGNSSSQFNADGSFQIGAASIANLKFSQSSDVISITAKKDGTDDIDLAFLTQASGGTTAERMRIDSSGNLLLNTTDKTGGGQLGTSRFCLKINGAADNGILVHDTRTSSGTDNALVFVRGSSTVGTIQTSTSATAFNTSSDYRLKENIQPMKNGLERLNKLKPSKFNWKETGESSEGFIAHEVQEAGWLEGVSGNKDDEQMQMVDYGKITPLLVKAIQELSAKVEELESKIDG